MSQADASPAPNPTERQAVLAVVLFTGEVYLFYTLDTGDHIPLLVRTDDVHENLVSRVDQLLAEHHVLSDHTEFVTEEVSLRPLLDATVRLAIAHIDPDELDSLWVDGFVTVQPGDVQLRRDTDIFCHLLARHIDG